MPEPPPAPTAESPRVHRSVPRAVVVGGWVATLVVAVGVSSWAVSLASRQVTDPLPPSPVVDASATTSPARPTEETPSASPDGQAETRTVTAVGGRAAFRAAGGRVTLVWATPAAGFDVDAEEEHAGLEVRFRSDTHESRIRARPHDGTVIAEVEERPDDHD